MNILVIEDDDQKCAALLKVVDEATVEQGMEVTRATSLSAAVKQIYENRFDLILMDLLLPLRNKEDEPEDVSDELVSAISQSDLNRAAGAIAISGFPDLVSEQQKAFADAGIVLVHYDQVDSRWANALKAALERVRERFAFDFIVVVALEKERAAYSYTTAELGSYRNVRGLDCQELRIGSRKGVCIKLPGMGLVSAASVTATAIDRLNPPLVAMSGICAGVGDVQLGTLVVAELSWEHQAGKWAAEGFKVEHYDVLLDANTRTTLSQMIAADIKAKELKEGLIEDVIVFAPVVLGPMASGSAVIADEAKVNAISDQHRKVAAVDMEVYGVYRAAQLSAASPRFFAAKTVVDKGDANKQDTFQEYGAILSARFVVSAIDKLLS